MEPIKLQNHILNFLELFHGKVMLEKQLQGPCNSTETH